MSTVSIGIDLNPNTADQVNVLDGPGEMIHQEKASTNWDELSSLLEAVTEKIEDDQEMVVVLEATGMAWFPVSVFFDQHEIEVYRIKGQRSKDLGEFLEKHAKSDPVDARALALMHFLIPDKLNRLHFADPDQHALKRWVQRREDYVDQKTAEINRLQDLIKWALPTLSGESSRFTGKKMRKIISKTVNSDALKGMGKDRFYEWCRRRNGELTRKETDRLYEASMEARTFYKNGSDAEYYHPRQLEQEARDLVQEITHLEEKIKKIEKKIRDHNKQVLPEKPLTSMYGTAKLTESVLKAFLGDGSHFPNLDCVEAYVGYIPKTDDSGEKQRTGTKIRKDGPAVLKKFLYNAVETARQWDPQIAAKYHREMVEKGNPHRKAICNCVNKYLARIMRVLRTGEEYELRDCNGDAVSVEEAQKRIREHYKVPDKVRERLRNRSS